MRVALLTREYPPEVYGGAGVHVEYLARELRALEDVDGARWGADRDGRGRAHRPGTRSPATRRTWPRCGRCRSTSRWPPACEGAELVHSAHLVRATSAGHLAKLIYDIPHVATVHSLEPLRPWKAEQLGGGYALSSWCERTALEGADAVIAVSRGHARRHPRALPGDRPRRASQVIYNGIDTERVHARPGHRRARALRRRPGAAVGRVRRADHAPEGRAVPARGGAAVRSRRRSSCCARARRTRPRSAPRSRGAWSGCGPSAGT